ncbi:MAG: tRNA 2-thiouridine(34) synthase MnmA [Kiritimatiellia bacterium]
MMQQLLYNNGMKKILKVAVGLSGGVDSSLAAVLLKRNYNVEGVTIRLHESFSSGLNQSSCGNEEAVERAQKAADELAVPLHVINASEDFFNKTLKKCWEAFEKGQTPNPCHICNKTVKFSKLWETAEKIGADRIATGHYARITSDTKNRPVLKRGIDRKKDQSYFLSGVSQEILRHTLFPLGEMKKSEVRELAAHYNLSNADQSESQDLCFASRGKHFSNILQEKFKGRSFTGVFIDETGKVLGTHEGTHQYTIGQRRGLGFATGSRMKIISINPVTGIITVSDREEAAHKEDCTARPFQWYSDPLLAGDSVIAQLRYKQNPAEAVITETDNLSVSVRFSNPVFGVTPGQILVLYRDDCVLGWGTITC